MISIRQLPLALFALAAFAAPVSGQGHQVFPTAIDAYPHDVAPAPDGTVWYSAQRKGALGILDPATARAGRSSSGRNRRRTGSSRARTGPPGSPTAA